LRRPLRRLCCLLPQQVCAESALNVGIAAAGYHQAGHWSIAVDADLSILEVINVLTSIECFKCLGADVALLGAADKEVFAGVGVENLLEFCVLADDELTKGHCVGAGDVIVFHCVTVFGLLIMLTSDTQGVNPECRRLGGVLGGYTTHLTIEFF